MIIFWLSFHGKLNAAVSSLLSTFVIMTRFKLNVTEGDCSFVFKNQPPLPLGSCLVVAAAIAAFEMSLQFGRSLASAATSALSLWITHSIRQFEIRQWPLHFCTRWSKRQQQQDKFTRWLRKVMSVGSGPSTKYDPVTALVCYSGVQEFHSLSAYEIRRYSLIRRDGLEMLSIYFTLATLTFFAGHKVCSSVPLSAPFYSYGCSNWEFSQR